MKDIPPFSERILEEICLNLSEHATKSEIDSLFLECVFWDLDGESIKWRRLRSAFRLSQSETKSADKVLAFIEKFLEPSRFINDSSKFGLIQMKLNETISSLELEFGSDGKFRQRSRATALEEGEARLTTLQEKLAGRLVHEEVSQFLNAKALSESYSHLVSFAFKALMIRIQVQSGSRLEGVKLINEVFNIKNPLLSFNSLATKFDELEHKGFVALLKGCDAAMKNPLGFGPEFLGQEADDAADSLSLLSLLCRKLDRCKQPQR